jgi:hypothetical protein
MLHQALRARLAGGALLWVKALVQVVAPIHAFGCARKVRSAAGECDEVGSGHGEAVPLRGYFSQVWYCRRSGRSLTAAVLCEGHYQRPVAFVARFQDRRQRGRYLLHFVTLEAAGQHDAARTKHALEIGSERDDRLRTDVGHCQVGRVRSYGIDGSHESIPCYPNRDGVEVAGHNLPCPQQPRRLRQNPRSRAHIQHRSCRASGNPRAPRGTAAWCSCTPGAERHARGSRRSADRPAGVGIVAPGRRPGRSVVPLPWAAADRARPAPSRAALPPGAGGRRGTNGEQRVAVGRHPRRRLARRRGSSSARSRPNPCSHSSAINRSLGRQASALDFKENIYPHSSGISRL